MSRTARRPAALSAAGLAMAVALAGCGSGGASGGSPAAGQGPNGEAAKSATQIFSDAKHATATASSVHMAGTVSSSSERIGLDVVSAGNRAGGTVRVDGTPIDVVVDGTTLYVQGSAHALASLFGNRVEEVSSGRWVKTTTTDADVASLAQLFDVSAVVEQIKPAGTVTKGAAATLDGTGAIVLTDSANGGRIYVATTGPPYILRIVGGTGEAGSLTFTAYGTAQPPAVPTGAVDLGQPAPR